MTDIAEPTTLTPEFSITGKGPFRQFWIWRGCLSFAGSILGLAISWQVYALTRDPFDLGMIGLVQFLPALLLALPAGHAIDRYKRRTIIQISTFSYLALSICLFVGTLTKTLQIWEIFVLAGVLGSTRAFEMPAGFSYLSGLVPREHMSRAVAWRQSVAQTATVLGPMIGGALYTQGATLTYAACVMFFAVGSLLAISFPPAAQVQNRVPPTLRSVLAGLEFIFREKTLLGVVSLDLFAVLLGGATALLPIYARDILAVGPIGLGALRSAPAVGALLVAALLARYPLRRHNGWAILGGVAMFGVATCFFALSTSPFLSLFALAVMGGSDAVSVFVRITLIQLRTPDEMMGRVSSVNSIFIGTSNQLGDFESGATAALFGTVPAAFIGGLGTIIVVGLWAFLFPSLRRIDRLEEPVT